MEAAEQNQRDREQVAEAMDAWRHAFSEERPDHCLALYAEDAVLWGTLSPTRRDTPEAIRDYFNKVFSFTDRHVTFHDPFIRIYGDTAQNTGSYTFSWVREGKKETLRARYSLAYVKCKGCWLIVDHHSSVMPV